MVRVVKTAALRQDEILDTAQRLFLERGYEATSIQAIIDEIGIAKGTFYHHYPSKPALLDALVARMVVVLGALIQPLIDDPALGAVDKLNAVFLSAGAWKTDHRALMLEMHRALYTEANEQLRLRIQREGNAMMMPIVARILEQGVAEGVMNTRYPRHAAQIVLELGITLGRTLGDALLRPDATPDLASILTDLDAYHDAVGRLLGAAPGAIRLVDRDAVAVWLEAARTPKPQQEPR